MRTFQDLIPILFSLQRRFWTSDEYGPYIYLISAEGALIKAIQPPDAILPMIDGKLNFTSETDPDTGRQGNQGDFQTMVCKAGPIDKVLIVRVRGPYARLDWQHTLCHAAICDDPRWRR